MRWLALTLLAAAVLATAAASAEAAGPFPHPTATEPPFKASDYWVFADRIAAALDERWDAKAGSYWSPREDGGREHDTRFNASMLLGHAIAALKNHQGATRRDGRARALVRRFTTRPGWGPIPGSAPQLSRPSRCWSTNLDARKEGHLSLDSKVAEALTYAWQARARLRLSRTSVATIVKLVDKCAHHRIWRYPMLTGNQINWYSELYASDATVTRNAALLRGDYRKQLTRFAGAIKKPMRGRLSNNLGKGFQFHYHPDYPDSAPINLDSPEYANIVAQALQYYDRALKADMRPLPAAQIRLLRAWVGRLIGGYWTHAGYLNWDTGLGRGRWQSAQYWAFALQGLGSIVVSKRFWPAPRYGYWAKAIFDRGLLFYLRLADDADSAIAPKRMFGIASDMEEYDAFTSRMLANAARAVAMGFGSLPARDPPPLWSFDYDTGRIAISTPRYSTALVPFNRGAFPYGGIDPVRLFGSGQKPVATLGGVPPEAMGVVVRDVDGREHVASARTEKGAVGKPLQILASPFGTLSKPLAYPWPSYAGTFARLQVRGRVQGERVRITSNHEFREAWIASNWTVECLDTQMRCDDEIIVHFPSYGRGAPIEAELWSGELIRLPDPPDRGPIVVGSVKVADVRRFIIGHAPGYSVYPTSLQGEATIMVLPTEPQDTNPSPGPTLTIVLELPNGFAERHLGVRIVP